MYTKRAEGPEEKHATAQFSGSPKLDCKHSGFAKRQSFYSLVFVDGLQFFIVTPFLDGNSNFTLQLPDELEVTLTFHNKQHTRIKFKIASR